MFLTIENFVFFWYVVIGDTIKYEVSRQTDGGKVSTEHLMSLLYRGEVRT